MSASSRDPSAPIALPQSVRSEMPQRGVVINPELVELFDLEAGVHRKLTLLEAAQDPSPVVMLLFVQAQVLCDILAATRATEGHMRKVSDMADGAKGQAAEAVDLAMTRMSGILGTMPNMGGVNVQDLARSMGGSTGEPPKEA